MLRMKYVIGWTVVLTAGLLSIPMAVAASDVTPANSDRWDDGGPIPGTLGELAMLQGDDVAPPGPPPGEGDDRPLPPRRGRGGPDADRRQPPGPPRDGDINRMGPPGRGPDGMGQPRGPGRGMGPGGPMGPGMNPNCPLGVGMGFGPMMRNDPEVAEILRKDSQFDRDSRQLAAEYRQATAEKREKIKKNVEELVNKQFDVRQQRRNLELKHLEDQLQRLRDAVTRREKARKAIVDKRVSELLGTEQELDF